MTINLHHRAGRLIRRRLQRLSRSALRERIDALRMRLARHGLPGRAAHRRTPGRFTPIERVMRRPALHLSRAFTAHVSLQALLSAGITRHMQRVEVRPLRGRDVPVHTLRQRERMTVTQRLLRERVTATQRVLQERLLQRLTRVAANAAAPRAAVVTRVEQRSVFPPVQLTMVRMQPALPPAARVAAESTIAPAADARAVPAIPRSRSVVAPLMLPPQELSRLTDHVISQLDHRVLSWQERTGRV